MPGLDVSVVAERLSRGAGVAIGAVALGSALGRGDPFRASEGEGGSEGDECIGSR